MRRNPAAESQLRRQVFGPYEVISQLGRGASGRTYVVRHWNGVELFALKAMNLAEEESTAMNTELMSMIRLSHPSIIRYIEHFVADDLLCIVMEYAKGGDLAQLITRQNGNRFSEEQIWWYLDQIAEGLRHLHYHHVIHRDLKPANIFVADDGTLKIGDFGSVRIFASAASVTQKFVGTTGYASPEQCNGVPYKEETDIWGLGCILYELATLQPAFRGTSLRDLLNKIELGQHGPLPTGYSPALTDMIRAMLSRDPRGRPTINDICDRTARVAPKPSLWRRSVKWCLWIVFVAAVVFVLLLMVGLCLPKPSAAGEKGSTGLSKE
jgi:NIMA (never in mitosis gene a)-related kinase